MDESTINDLMTGVEENSVRIQDIVDSIVHSYSESLDVLMKDIYTEVIEVDNCPLCIIENFFIKLSNIIYFVSPNIERLGIREGIGKISAQEKYNNIYIENKTDSQTGKNRTAAELSAISENGSRYENIVYDTYNKAYKILKAKLSSAQTMCATLSKILSIRSSIELNDDKLEGKQILNEVYN